MEEVNGRLLQLEIGQVRLMDEMEKLREKMIKEMKKLKDELEGKLSGHKDKVKAEGEEPAGSSSKLLTIRYHWNRKLQRHWIYYYNIIIIQLRPSNVIA